MQLLFRKNIDRYCAYCQFAGRIDEAHMICSTAASSLRASLPPLPVRSFEACSRAREAEGIPEI